MPPVRTWSLSTCRDLGFCESGYWLILTVMVATLMALRVTQPTPCCFVWGRVLVYLMVLRHGGVGVGLL